MRIKTDFDIPAHLFKTRKVFTLEAKIISSQFYQNKVFALSHSNKQDLLMTDDRPEYDANILHVYADSDWATCP